MSIENPAADRIIHSMSIRRILQACLIAGVILVSSAVAFCEEPLPVKERKEAFPWAAAGYAVCCLAVVCAVAFKHAKRTHLD